MAIPDGFYTLRIFADRLDLFQVSSLCQQVIDPACIAAVPYSSLLTPNLGYMAIQSNSLAASANESNIDGGQ